MSRSRPRLLYVVTLAEVGGAQSYVRDLLPAMADRYDVAVAAHGDGPLRAATDELGIPFFPLQYVRRPLSPIFDALGLIELIVLFRRFRPDLVHLNSSKVGVLGRIAAAAARIPLCVFTAHGWAFKATTGRSSTLYLWADRAVRPLTSMIVCVSENELAKGVAAGVCVSDRATVIPNAVDVGPRPEPRDPDTGATELISVGRLAEPKDFPTLIRAIQHLERRDVRLRIIGDGPLRAVIERQLENSGLADIVEIVGEVPDVPRRLRQADVFVLSSASEGMPLSVLEAMAAGLPVVASAVEGMDEVVVEGATGFLFEPGSSQQLADRLGRLIDDPDARIGLGSSGRDRAETLFDLPRWRQAHLELYDRLLASLESAGPPGKLRVVRRRRSGD